MTTWTQHDQAAALREGWLISNSLGLIEIQRHDEAEIFPADAEAIAHVYWKAGTGSELHRRAIAYTLRLQPSGLSSGPLPKYKEAAE